MGENYAESRTAVTSM